MKHITTAILAITTLLLVLFLNGNIKIPKLPIPTLSKFFHPVHGFWNNVENIEDEININTSKLSANATVVYDDRWVPHIFADNLSDALFLQGYTEAQNRLFQMDFITRAATGQLSEVMGPITLKFDKERNRSQIELAAENAVEGWEKNKEEYKLLEAYVAGVNEYINNLEEKDYPIEFKLLGYKPSPWSTKKSALVYKYMADVLAGYSADVEASNTLALIGDSLFQLIYQEHDDGGYPVVPYEKKYNFANPYAHEATDTIVAKKYYKHFYEKRNPGVGSNNWAVAKMKSASGNPILCNDPHLSLSLPSIWIEEQIQTPEFNAYGVSFPGFPGIMIGFNEHIAWGETNVGHDVEDFFEVKWANADKTQYWLDGQKVNTKVVIKEIKIKNESSVYDTIRYVHQGVVKLESTDKTSDLAVRWLAVDEQKEPEFMTFIDVMKSKNYEEYAKAILNFNTPAQNFLFASKTNDIALTVNGKLPIRQTNDGRFVEAADKSSNDWEHYIPRDQNPFILNPKSGFVSSSNQRSAGKDYPYYYTGKFEHSRNRVINDSLSKVDKFTLDKLKQLQANSYSAYAIDGLKIILNSLKLKHETEEIYQMLAGWNGAYTAESKAATVYEKLYQGIYENTFEEILKYKDTIDVLKPEEWRLLELLKSDKNAIVFDDIYTSQIENADDIIHKSYQAINKDVNSSIKPWGEYKPVKINHYTRLSAFSSKALKIDGHKDAPNAMQETFGPSWRMIVELGPEPIAFGVYPGGQSGNPLSAHYMDQIEKWTKLEYNKLTLYKNKKDIKSKSTIFFNIAQ